MVKLLEPRVCHYCGEPYTPNRYVTRKFCSRACSNRWRRQHDGARWLASLEKAVAATKVKCAEKRAAILKGRFGDLSERELQIIAAVREQSYMDGYNAALSPVRKTRIVS